MDLSERERRLLARMLEGRRASELAAELDLSTPEVHRWLQAILDRLGAKRHAEGFTPGARETERDRSGFG